MRAVNAIEWACVLCGRHIWVSRATNLYQILHLVWIFLRGNYLDDSKAAAMSYWWLAASSQHNLLHHVLCRVFGETSNHPGDSVPQQSRYGALWLLAFLKTKITFEREEILDLRWDSEKYHRAADWRTVWGPKVPTLKGTLSLSYVQCFLYLVSSSIKVSIFHTMWLDNLIYITKYSTYNYLWGKSIK